MYPTSTFNYTRYRVVVLTLLVAQYNHNNLAHSHERAQGAYTQLGKQPNKNSHGSPD